MVEPSGMAGLKEIRAMLNSLSAQRRWWIVLVLVLVALVLFLLPRAQAGLAGQPVLLVTEREGEIRYSAAFDPVAQEVSGGIQYDYLSAMGIQDYIAYNRKTSQELARSKANQLRVKVIFSRPLPQAEFEQFVQVYDLKVHTYTMRAVESNGTRVTIIGAPEGEELVPAESFGVVLRDIKERGDTEFKGWVDAEVTTDSGHLTLIQDDPRVFVTEAPYALIYKALTPSALRRAQATEATIEKIQAGTGRTVQVTGPSLYLTIPLI